MARNSIIKNKITKNMNSETNRGEIVLKQLVDVMGRAMNYLEAPDSPAGEQIKSIC